MLKTQEIADPNSCLNQADDDQILFVITSKDPIGADIVEEWARRSQHYGIHLDKIEDAFKCAQLMRDWQEAHHA